MKKLIINKLFTLIFSISVLAQVSLAVLAEELDFIPLETDVLLHGAFRLTWYSGGFHDFPDFYDSASEPLSAACSLSSQALAGLNGSPNWVSNGGHPNKPWCAFGLYESAFPGVETNRCIYSTEQGATCTGQGAESYRWINEFFTCRSDQIFVYEWISGQKMEWAPTSCASCPCGYTAVDGAGASKRRVGTAHHKNDWLTTLVVGERVVTHGLW